MGIKINIKNIVLILFVPLFLKAITDKDRVILASMYPYTIKGITYYPHRVAVGDSKYVLASWYGEYFHGRKTAIGETYDMYGYTAAHKTYPLGTVLLVTNPKNGKSLKVRINDRGPFWNDRELDLSMGAAEFLGTKQEGVAKVNIKVLSVPSVVNSISPKEIESVVPLNPHYNIGYTASSYANINKETKRVTIEIGTFLKRDEADKYLKKLKKYLPKAHIFQKDFNYKIEFFLEAKEDFVKSKLKKLKKKGLITGYGICWSYD
ncbi:MAG: septal ring lytic transglycosylase RlpA family protein [Epsilonproteobacteria bacterium]|nr:septal ring lytic transglycosylase RlpA family protein [Campylobacterota bacterium]